MLSHNKWQASTRKQSDAIANPHISWSESNVPILRPEHPSIHINRAWRESLPKSVALRFERTEPTVYRHSRHVQKVKELDGEHGKDIRFCRIMETEITWVAIFLEIRRPSLAILFSLICRTRVRGPGKECLPVDIETGFSCEMSDQPSL